MYVLNRHKRKIHSTIMKKPRDVSYTFFKTLPPKLSPRFPLSDLPTDLTEASDRGGEGGWCLHRCSGGNRSNIAPFKNSYDTHTNGSAII